MTAEGLLDDLLNIEVDILVADDVGWGPMPDIETALGEVFDSYIEWLEVHYPSEELSSGPPVGDPAAEWEWVRSRAVDRARRLVEAADVGQDAEPPSPVLRRIAGNAAQLGAVAAGDVAEPVDRMRIVRKAWELGTGTIVAQTVVQLDGDALSRVDEDTFLAVDRAQVRALHRDAVEQALGHWRALVDLVVALATKGFQVALAGLRHPGTAWTELKRRRDDRRSDGVERLSVPDLVRRQTWSRIGEDWARFRELVVPLFSEGGVTIESPGEDRPVARTVIQPDGDALWFVSIDAAEDGAALEAHSARVRTWYDASAAAADTVRQVVDAFLRAIASALAVFWTLATAASGIAWGWLALAIGLLAALVGVVLLVIVRAGLGHMVRRAVGMTRR